MPFSEKFPKSNPRDVSILQIKYDFNKQYAKLHIYDIIRLQVSRSERQVSNIWLYPATMTAVFWE